MSKDQVLAYDVEGAVTASNMSRSRIYAAIKSGELGSFEAGRRRMVSAKALQKFIDSLEKAAGEATRKVVAA